MSRFTWPKQFLSNFDIYPINFSYGVNNGSGYKTATAGFLVLVMSALSIGAILSTLITTIQNKDTPSVSINEGRDDTEEVNFAQASETARPFVFLMVFSINCMIYHSNATWEGNRDCLINVLNTQFWSEVNNYTNQFNGLPVRSPLSVGSFLSDCPDEFFDEEFNNYTEGQLSEWTKNHTFCMKQFDLPIKTSRTYMNSGEFRFTGETHESLLDRLALNMELLSQVETDRASCLKELEALKETMSDSEYQENAYFINVYFDFFKIYFNYPGGTEIRFVVRQKKLTPSEELETGIPLQKEMTGYEVFFHYDFDSRSYIMNNGIFSHWTVKFKNQYIYSNLGYGFFWRFTRNWTNYISTDASMERTVQYDPRYGYLVSTYCVENYHDEVQISYLRLLEVMAEIGGNLGVIAYLSLLIMFLKGTMLMRSLANSFFLEKLKEQGQLPYSESIWETVSLIFRKIFPCFFRGFVRPVHFKGKTREAIDYVSELIDQTLSLENDIMSKRKFRIIESALTTSKEREVIQNISTSIRELSQATLPPLEKSLLHLEKRLNQILLEEISGMNSNEDYKIIIKKSKKVSPETPDSPEIYKSSVVEGTSYSKNEFNVVNLSQDEAILNS